MGGIYRTTTEIPEGNRGKMGVEWIFMDFHGFSWIWMDFHGFGWICMDLDGFGWIWMDLNENQ